MEEKPKRRSHEQQLMLLQFKVYELEKQMKFLTSLYAAQCEQPATVEDKISSLAHALRNAIEQAPEDERIALLENVQDVLEDVYEQADDCK